MPSAGGILVDNDGLVQAVSASPLNFVNGWGVDVDGKLCISEAAAAVFLAGLARDVDGSLIVGDGPAVAWVRGWGINALNQVVALQDGEAGDVDVILAGVALQNDGTLLATGGVSAFPPAGGLLGESGTNDWNFPDPHNPNPNLGWYGEPNVGVDVIFNEPTATITTGSPAYLRRGSIGVIQGDPYTLLWRHTAAQDAGYTLLASNVTIGVNNPDRPSGLYVSNINEAQIGGEIRFVNVQPTFPVTFDGVDMYPGDRTDEFIALGATYLPSNDPIIPASVLPGNPVINWDFGDITSMFQDAGMTTPVTADGQDIGAIADQGSSGSDWTERAGKPPTYSEAGGLNGESCAVFDGALQQALTMSGTIDLGTESTQLYIIYYERPSPTALAWFVRNFAGGKEGQPEVYGQAATPFTYWTSSAPGVVVINSGANSWVAGYIESSAARGTTDAGIVSTSDGNSDVISTALGKDKDGSAFETHGIGHYAHGKIQQIAMWTGASAPTEQEIKDYVLARFNLVWT